MRLAWSRPLGLLAVVLLVAGCAGHGAAAAGLPPRPSPSAGQLRVGCGQVIPPANSGTVGGARVVLGVLSVPPAHLPPAVPSGLRSWRYFRKWGLGVRAASPAVVVSLPRAWQHLAAISWGNNVGIASSIRLLSCPRQAGAWNRYAGGFYLRSPSACVPLVFQVGRQSVTRNFGIGRNCGSPAA